MKRRFLAILMSLVMLMGILPVTALAVEEIASGECGENLTWMIDENNTLTISGNGAMWDYPEEYPTWYENYYVENVVIEEGVTHIGSFTFFDHSLDSIMIPASVTSIGELAFHNAYIYGGIWVDEGNKNFSSDENGILFNKGKTELIYIHSEVRGTYTVSAKVTKIADFVGGSGISRLVFEGNAPAIGENAFGFITAAAFYPVNNPTWTEEVMQDYYGMVIWQSYDPANPDFTVYGDCGDKLTWSADEEGTLTISGEGEMWNYNVEWPAWIACASTINNIVIEEGVTNIGAYAFEGLYDIYNITIPASVKRIGECAFMDTYIAEGIWVADDSKYYCNDENGVLYEKDMEMLLRAPNTLAGDYEVPEGVCAIEAYAFRHSNITNIILPESLTDIGDSAFELCWGLESVIEIPANVSVIGEYAFKGMYFVEAFMVDEDNQFYSNDEYGVLYNKDKTELIKTPGYVPTTFEIPESVEVIADYAFEDCSNFDHIEIPDSVTYIGDGAFSGCYDLRNISIPESVKFVSDYAFENCENLRKITFEGDNTTISEFAFEGCWNLSKIIFEGNAPRIFGFEFFWPAVRVYYPEGNATWTEDIMTSYGEMATFVAYDPSEPVPVDIIAEGECGDELTWKLDEDGLLTISGEGAIWDYEYLGSPWIDYREMIQSIVIEAGVTRIGQYAFDFCYYVENISIPNTVTSIGSGAFSECFALSVINIPSSVETIEDGAFDVCSSMIGIWVDEGNKNYSSDENGALYNKDKTELIKLPCGYEGSFVIPASVTEIAYRCFTGCSYLTELNISANVAYVDGGTFNSCDSLENIVVDKNNQFYSSDENGVLFNKDKTELIRVPVDVVGSYVIPDGVTYIGSEAFSGCREIYSITIPASLTNIYSFNFKGCSSLVEVIVDDNNPDYCSENGLLFSKDKTTLVFVPDGMAGTLEIPASVTNINDFAFWFCFGIEKVKFAGNAPSFNDDDLIYWPVEIYYPENNATWTEEVMLRFGYEIIWIPYTPSARPQGDVNGDGAITNADLIMVARYIVGLYNAADVNDIKQYGDMDGDGKITNADLISIARIIVGIN